MRVVTFADKNNIEEDCYCQKQDVSEIIIILKGRKGYRANARGHFCSLMLLFIDNKTINIVWVAEHSVRLHARVDRIFFGYFKKEKDK